MTIRNRTDAEGRYVGIRTRLGIISGQAGPPGPAGAVREVWRGAWADGTDYHMGDLVYRDHGLGSGLVRTYIAMEAHTAAGDGPMPGGTSYWHEFNESDLIIDGSRAMVGNLNMNHHDIDNANDVEVENNANFTGGVGAARIDGPRVIDMAGADSDSEGRVTDINRLWFLANNLDQLSPPAAGTVHYEDDTREFMVTTASGGGEAYYNPIGWSIMTCLNASGGSIPAGALVEIYFDSGSDPASPIRPCVRAWTPGASEQPVLSATARMAGLTMGASDSSGGAQIIAVMRRGYAVGLIARPVGEGGWTENALLWGNEDHDYSVRPFRPDAPGPIVFVGVLVAAAGESGPSKAYIDVRVCPGITELSGVKVEDPEDFDVMIYDAATECHVPRRLEVRDLVDGRRWAWMFGRR
jgi:hypothetical protein